MSPLVVIVSGLPATGKTTLSRQLGRQLGLPVWSKDALKEQLWEALGQDREIVKPRLGRVAVALLFQALEIELQAGRGAIVESTFRPAWDVPVFLQLQRRYPCHLISLYCTCDEAVREERFRVRVTSGERHPCHPDAELLRQGADTSFSFSGAERIGPLRLAAAPYVLDTTVFDTIDVQAVCAAIRDGTTSDC